MLMGLASDVATSALSVRYTQASCWAVAVIEIWSNKSMHMFLNMAFLFIASYEILLKWLKIGFTFHFLLDLPLQFIFYIK
jgi:hypothetical protein